MGRRVMLSLTDADENNNKFYEIEELPDGMVKATWGRIGKTSSSKIYPPGSFDKLQRGKERKGYRVFGNPQSSTPAKLGLSAAQRVTKSLFDTVTGPNDNLTRVLLTYNRHAISDATGGKIQVNATSGVAETALGPVTPDMVAEARIILQRLPDGSFTSRDVNTYLSLIPQAVKNLRTNDWITASWLSDQSDLLDALDSTSAASAVPDDGAFEAIPFRNKLRYVDSSSDVFAAVAARFAEDRNSRHVVAANYTLSELWTIEDEQRAEWEARKRALRKTRHLWHGSTAGNVLSILRTGLICPPRSSQAHGYTGRMLGDGVYFSDQSTKSLNYALGVAPGQRGTSDDAHPMMFLVDVVMGNELTVTAHDHSLAQRAQSLTDSKGRAYNSIFAKGGANTRLLNNEMVVWNTDQISLTHLCKFAPK